MRIPEGFWIVLMGSWAEKLPPLKGQRWPQGLRTGLVLPSVCYSFCAAEMGILRPELLSWSLRTLFVNFPGGL